MTEQEKKRKLGNYYAENSEQLKAYQRNYYAENSEQLKAYQRQRYADNRDKIRAAQRQYYAKNRERILHNAKLRRRKIRAEREKNCPECESLTTRNGNLILLDAKSYEIVGSTSLREIMEKENISKAKAITIINSGYYDGYVVCEE